MQIHPKKIKMVLWVLVALAAAVPGLSRAAENTLDVRVVAGNDDAEEYTSGEIFLTSQDLDMVDDDYTGETDQICGVRFQDITIPSGATITNAYLEFTVDETGSDTTNLTIYGEDADDSDQFSSTYYDISSRTTTVTYVDWSSVPAWTAAGDQHQSPDLTDIVQEIIDRPGWGSGNAMTFIIKGTSGSQRVAKAYNLSSSEAPLLHVEYTSDVVDAYPAASSDDAEEANNGDMDLDDDQLDLIEENNSDQSVGVRFVNVGVPQGAIITSAYLEFYAPVSSSDGAGGGGGGRGGRGGGGGFTDLDIHGEDTDNAASFTSTRRNISNRDETDNMVEWNALPTWAAGNDYTSPDISAIVQEIVGRSGWSSGNAMAFIITGRGSRIAGSYDGAGGTASRMPRLHVEYYQDVYPYITVDNTVIGASCYVGSSPSAKEFTISNTGGGDMNYTISDDAAWLTLSETSGTIAPGESVTIQLIFSTSSEDVGTYDATITIEDSDASNSPVEIAVGVSVFELPEESSCDNIPLYATDIVSPSILILLDVSGSMDTMMNVQTEDFPQTPDLKDIVQEIVDRAAWSEGNAMAFIITGSGERNAVSYDGESGYAPLLHVEYNDGTDDYTLEVAVTQSSDDAEEGDSGHMYLRSNDLDLVYDGVNQTVGIRFQNITIPQGATITNAYMELAISEGGDTDTDLVIKGEASDNADTFAGGWTGGRGGGTWENSYNITSRTTTTAEVAWNDIEEWESAPQKERIEIGKSAISTLVKDRQVSWGFGTWTDSSTGGYTSDIDYTKVHVGCKSHTDTHQTNLQNAISAATTYRATPFEPSLAAGRKYFAGDKSDEAGDDYVNYDCESLVLVEVTDGLGNTDTTLEGVKSEAELLADNNISLVTVGFGIDDASQIQAAAAIANERGNEDSEDKLYALHEEVGGVGVPFLANNEAELIAALASIKNAVLDNLFHGSAPATTTTTDLGNLLLVANFNAGDWAGNLQAMARNDEGNWFTEDGEWANVVWNANENFPDTRKIFTVDATDPTTYAEFSDYTTTYMTCKDMGDIINSTPIVVTNPGSFYEFDGYMDWMYATERDPVVYVGANDGALHVFSLETGVEQWAFVPASMKTKLDKGLTDSLYDMCSAEYCHQYYVDGSPKVADVYLSTGWKTVLISGLREGGQSYFALDVTSGKALDDGSDPSVYMWEFTDTDLGESWSEASISRVVVDGSETETRWGAFFGSGYATTAIGQASKEAYLYGILVEDADAMWNDGVSDINKVKIFNKILLRYDGTETDFSVGETVTGAASGATATVVRVDSTSGVLEIEGLTGTFLDNETINGDDPTAPGKALVNGDVQESLTDNALTSPLAVDLDGDGQYIADHIYVGDLYGTMYRVSNIGYAQNPEVSTLLSLDLTSSDISPIRGKAGYAYSENEDEVWVYWGTGIYETTPDKINMEQQYFFGIRDQLGATDEISLDDLVQLEVKTDADGNKYIDGENPENKSWYIKLDNTTDDMLGSERAMTHPLVVDGVVFFTTFVPDDDLCTGSGTAYLYAVEYDTGLPRDDDDDPIIELPPGVPSPPVLNIPPGEDPEIFTNLTEGGTHRDDPDLDGLRVKLTGWKHMF